MPETGTSTNVATGQSATAPPSATGGAPVIEIRDLHKSYGTLEVLKGVDIAAPAGHVVALIGSSGIGQIHAAALLQPPRGQPAGRGDLRGGAGALARPRASAATRPTGRR